MLHAPPMPFDFFNRSRNAKWLDWNARIQLNPDIAAEYGIVAAYPGWPTGGNTLYDVSGRGNHGTLTNGPTWTRGKWGEPAIQLDGANDTIAITTPSLGVVHSFSFWINTTDTDAVVMGGAELGGTGNVQYCPYIDGTNIYYRADTATLGFVAHGGFSGWTHISIVRNDYTVYFFKNGASLGSYVMGASTAQAITQIGAFASGNNPYAGGFANLAYSLTVWTTAQIAELYRNPFLLYWQPSRTSIFDFRYDPTPYERSFRIASGGSWNDVSDSLVTDSAYATCETYDTVVPLEISDEGRLIPSAPTGFQVEIDAFASTPDSNIYSIEIFKNGVSVWSAFYGYGVNNLTGSLATYTWGNSTELFDTTWTASDAFSVTIQFYIGANALDTVYVDGARLTTWYSDGSSQTITVTIASATASASAPTITPAATVTMPTASSTAAASSPTVTPGATTVTVTTCSATASASSPTITPTVTIASATTSATAAAISPTITAGTSTITVSTAQATASSSAPTITPTVTIVSPTASATASASAPTVTAGATTITVTTGTATAAAIDAGITNATLITPGDATATAAVSALLVIFGSTSIVVGTATGTAAVSSPTIAAGTTTISVGVVSATAGAVVVAVVSGNTAGTSTASVFYVLHGTDTHPIPLLGADPRPHEAAGTSNRFRELKG